MTAWRADPGSGVLSLAQRRYRTECRVPADDRFERSFADPREKLKDYLLAAANVPFFHLTNTMVDNGELEEEDRQVLAERFRLNMKAGREDAWSRD